MNIEIIKTILKERKITYIKLSELSGISINTIKSVLCGKTKNPTIETVNAIKKALGINSEESVDGLSVPYITQEEEKIIRIYRALDEKRKSYFLTFAEGLKAQNENVNKRRD